MDDVKIANSPFFTFVLFTKRANLARIYKIFITMTLIKTWWKKGHVDNCGSYENDIFCEIGEFGKDSSKVWQKNWMMQQKRPIGSWQFSRKWQESIKGFAKTQLRWQRGKSWQTAIVRKWQILGEKGKFRQKWWECQKVLEASAK